VRLGQLKQNKEEYINLDKLEEIAQIPVTNNKDYKDRIYAIT
jgi:hypothetical protein